MLYQVVEIISRKTKRTGMVGFNSDGELREWLNGRREWNKGNNEYSIVAWSINHIEAYINLEKYGYVAL